MNINPGNSGGHSLVISAQGATKVSVAMLPLTEALDRYSPDIRVDMLKIDTDGSEPHVLDGAWNMLERDRPTILLEFTPEALRAYARDPLRLLVSLTELGYRMTLIDPVSDVVLPSTPQDVMDHIGRHGRQYVNLLFQADDGRGRA